MPAKHRKPAAATPVPKSKSNPSGNPSDNPSDNPPALVRSSDHFIVDQILPKFETHLVGGPSHSGKTTLICQTIERWRSRKDVFGHESYPLPFCYLACECSSGTMQSTLKRIGIDPATFPFLSAIEYDDIGGFNAALNLARRHYPDTEVLFIDGIHRLCGSKTNDDGIVGKFLADINKSLLDLNLTIIGIGNSTKVKGEEKFMNPRERFRGSGAWGTGTRTMIVVERARNDELTNPKRTVMIIPSNAPDQTLNFSLDSRGLFQPDLEEPDRYDDLASLISGYVEGDELTRADIMGLASVVGDEGIPIRSVDRYIDQMISEGRLERARWGRYRIPVKH